MNDSVLSYADLIRCVHDFSRGTPTVAVFRAYIDETANTEDTFFIVGGFVGHDDAWRSLEPKWLAALPPYLDYFHATDCFSGGGQFKENHIDIPERIQLLDALTDLVAEHDIRLIACRLPTTRFMALSPKKITNDFWRNRFVGLFPDVVRMACQYAIGSVSPPDPPKTTDHICHIWWEENQYTVGAVEFITEARKNPAFWWNIVLGTHAYGNKKGPAKIDLL